MSVTRPQKWLTLAAVVAGLLMAAPWSQSALRAAQDDEATDKKADDDDAAEEKEEEPAVSYEVPEGDSQELLKFIQKLRTYRPKTAREAIEHRKKAPEAIEAAAKKIVEVETDKSSEAYKEASSLLLQIRAGKIGQLSEEEQRKFIDELKEQLSEGELTQAEAGAAYSVTVSLERTGNTEMASEAYTTFGEVLAKSSNERFSRIGEMMVGAGRRMKLLGNELKLEGEPVGKGEFDWSKYRGKVVLVDFWATWCGPCLAEMPNVLKNYELYHDRGFDVVGISIDQDRQALEKFLEEKELPWVTLHDVDEEGKQKMATYYGVMGIPTVILVDREGKVVSLNARGEKLGELLKEMIGPPEEGQADSDDASKESKEEAADANE